MFDELQLGKANLYRKFSYADGLATPKHVEEGAVQSKPTTTLISKIEFADGRTIQYEYDKEERITKVTDSADGVYEYAYDELGQLLTEKVNGNTVNNMVYADSADPTKKYGNILEKNGVVYTYDICNCCNTIPLNFCKRIRSKLIQLLCNRCWGKYRRNECRCGSFILLGCYSAIQFCNEQNYVYVK